LATENLPATLHVSQKQDIPLPTKIPLTAKSDHLVTASSDKSYTASVNLFGVIPIGTTHVEVTEEDHVIAGGNPFGIKILAQGVLVVGLDEVQTSHGPQNPAKEAGLKMGDLIVKVNGKSLSTNKAMQEQIEASKGDSLSLEIEREGENHQLTLTPIMATDGCYRAGIWVRDSTAGLGTMTFYWPAKGIYGGLGHGVCDSDTGELMSLQEGEIVKAEIADVAKAKAGSAGEIKGVLFDNAHMGTILKNCECGVYGNLIDTDDLSDVTLRVARKQEVTRGKAQILSCIEGEFRYYDCEIEKINLGNPTQNMVIHVTDETLLAATGGIVQGMSGSPIIQNGTLVGAITHVFVNDPEKGYAVFAETMLDTARLSKEQIEQKAS
jgi:stage IV sporulation protein B